jgi:hypothetical protein
MDSQNPQREYHSPAASRQDASQATPAASAASAASPSSTHYSPAISEPPSAAPYQMAGSASAQATQTPAQRVPVVTPGGQGKNSGGAGSLDIPEDDDGPITVPVLGIQPFTMPSPAGQIDLGDQTDRESGAWVGVESTYDDDDDDDEVQYASNEGEDALNAFDVDIALGFGGEPLLRDDAFAFRERSWDTWKRTRRTILTLLALVAMLAVAILGASLAASYMRHETAGLSISPAQPTAGSFSGGLVIQSGPETIAPTPEAPKYQIGAWMSNNAPSGGSVTVFVRLTEDIKPLAHVPVSLVAQVPGGSLRYGPTKTDAYGLAKFTVRYGGLSGSPVFVTASAKVGSQTLTADTVFVPI